MRADRDVVAEAYEGSRLIERLAVIVRLHTVAEIVDKRAVKGEKVYKAMLKAGSTDKIVDYLLKEGFSPRCSDTKFRLGSVCVELSTGCIYIYRG